MLDWADLDAADVPFNMARDIVGNDGPGIAHGDSIVVTVASVRPDADLSGPPRMHFVVDTNPVFDAYRTSGVPYAGYVVGDEVYVGGYPALDRWSFELPDVDFLYPGDILHYYFSAEDTLAGGADPQTATLPATLDGFGVFPGDPGYQPLQWPTDFTVNALPSVRSATPGDVPPILFWNDFGDRGGQDEWMSAFAALDLRQGEDYDVFTTNAPSMGRGNGLGVLCPESVLQLHDHLVYTSGDLASLTLTGPKVWDQSEGEWAGDGSDDIALVESFIDAGGNFFGTGDGFLHDIATELSGTGLALANAYFGVDPPSDDVRPAIDGQRAPVAAAVGGNPVLLTDGYRDFVAYGSCPSFRMFDAVLPLGDPGVHVVSEFLDSDGQSGAYPYAALVAKEHLGGGRTLVSPVDFSAWYTPYGPQAKANVPAPTRAVALCDVLRWLSDDPAACQSWFPGGVTDAPAVPRFAATNHPNPFNPVTTIRLTLPADGRAELRIYNLRGELVRTLLNEARPSGTHAVDWDGRDDAGRSLASGVYFYEARAGGESLVGKTALVK